MEISTVDGHLLSAREDVNAGSTEKPLAAAVIEEKFMDNAQRTLSRPRAEEIRDLLLNIESCGDVRAIIARLGAA